MFEPINVRLEKARKETLNTAPRRDGSGGIGFRKLLLILLIFALVAVAVFVFYETDDPDFYYFRGSVYEGLGLYEQAGENYAMYLWLTEDSASKGYSDGFWTS